MQDVNKDV